LIRCEDFYAKYFPDDEPRANLDYCDNMKGFNIKDILEKLEPKAKEIIRWVGDNIKK